MENSQSTDIREQLENARKSMNERRFEEALEAITHVLLLDSTNEEALNLAIELGESEEHARLDTMEQAHLKENVPSRLHLEKAHQHFLEKDYDRALAEVTFVLSSDPFDHKARDLDAVIRAAVAFKSKGAEESSPSSVNAILLIAKRYSEREKFDEALEEIHEGLKKEPKHPELLWLCNSIIEQREVKKVRELQVHHNAMVLKIREQFARTEFDNALRDVLLALENVPEDKELLQIKDEIECSQKKWDEMKQFESLGAAVNGHIKSARQLLRLERMDEAATEIALGLLVSPNNQDLKKLEKELWKAHEKLEATRQLEQEAVVKENEYARVTIHLVAAEEFTMYGQFARALDEITQAYLIDPLNLEIKKAEISIRQQQQRASTSPLKLVYRNAQAR